MAATYLRGWKELPSQWEAPIRWGLDRWISHEMVRSTDTMGRSSTMGVEGRRGKWIRGGLQQRWGAIVRWTMEDDKRHGNGRMYDPVGATIIYDGLWLLDAIPCEW